MTLPIQAESAVKIKKVLKLVSKLNLDKQYFFQVRASLFSTCFWADALGYEEILLVGIDLNSPDYFYENESKWLDTVIPNPFFDTKQDYELHPTNDESAGFSLVEAMRLLDSHIKADIKIQNPDSLLAQHFKVVNE